MPIYEYECPKCGRFEVIQKVSDEPCDAKPGCSEPDCPRSARRLVSAAAFHLKGSGWYKTDYASPASGSEAGAQGGTEGGGDSSGSSGSDSDAGSGGSSDGSGDSGSGDSSGSSSGSGTASKSCLLYTSPSPRD